MLYRYIANISILSENKTTLTQNLTQILKCALIFIDVNIAIQNVIISAIFSKNAYICDAGLPGSAE